MHDLIEHVPPNGTTIERWLTKLRRTIGKGRSRNAEARGLEDISNALRQLAHVLLQAIRVHAVSADQEDLDSFQRELQRLNASISAETDPSQVLLIAGSADQALQIYNRQITRFIRAQRTEMQRMVATLTETVATISNGSERSYAQLEDIGWRIQKASVIEDIRVINTHLAECLQSLQNETLRQKDEAAKAITLLRQGLETRSEVDLSHVNHEPVATGECAVAASLTTGLAGRAAVETALRLALQQRSHTFAVVFTLKGMQAIEARSGAAGIEQAAEMFVGALNERLKSQQIYRWNQACFLALLERPESLESIQIEISRFTSRRLDITIESRGRSAFIPLCSSAVVIPIFNMRSMEMLIQQVDASMRL